MKIVDYISGELIITAGKQYAIKLAQERVKNHNLEYNFGRYGKHNSCNAIMTIKDDIIIINVKR